MVGTDPFTGRRSRSLAALGVTAALLLTSACGGGSSSGGSSDKVELSLADSFPPGHVITKEGSDYFMKRAGELSDGTITFKHYPAEQLAAAPDLLDAVKNGVSDISYVGIAYVNDLPLSDVGTLPGSFTDPITGSTAYWNLLNDTLLDKEYLPQGVRPLYATLLPPYNLGTTKKVETLADIKGMTMRSSGGTMSRTLEALGGTPVQMPAPEINQAMTLGIVDAWVGPPSSMPPYDLDEIIKYGTTNLNLGSFAVVFVINENVRKGLSDKQQKALKTAGEEAVEHLAKGIKAENDAVIDDFSKKGIDMYELAPDEKARWDEKTRGVWPGWAKELDKKGLDGTGMIKKWQDHLAQVKDK